MSNFSGFNILDGIPYDRTTGVTSPDMFFKFIHGGFTAHILCLIESGNAAGWDDTNPTPTVSELIFLFRRLSIALNRLKPNSFKTIRETQQDTEALFRTDRQDFNFLNVHSFMYNCKWKDIKLLLEALIPIVFRESFKA
jgi:hypothetical protein